MKLLPLALLLLLGSEGPTIRVSSRVVMDGGSIRVTCHVPALPPSDYLDLELGILPITSSTRHVPATPWTTEQLFEHVDCAAEVAFCALVKEQDTYIVQVPILVIGC